jgi:hypothetical protein
MCWNGGRGFQVYKYLHIFSNLPKYCRNEISKVTTDFVTDVPVFILYQTFKLTYGITTYKIRED